MEVSAVLWSVLSRHQNSFEILCIAQALIPQFHAICKVVQLCCRIRGFKHVMKLFPHEVSHLELCLMLLRAQVPECSIAD